VIAFLHRCLATLRACLVVADRDGPWATGPVHCVACGYSFVIVLPTASAAYDVETGVIDMLECPECGKFTCCSD
jgi:hypothetical protein